MQRGNALHGLLPGKVRAGSEVSGARCTTNSAASCSERHRSVDVYRTRRTRLPRLGPRTPARDDAAGQLDVECGQESVQVGDVYDGFPRSDACERAGLGRSLLASHGPATACRRRWSSPAGRRAMKTNSRPGRSGASRTSSMTRPAATSEPASSSRLRNRNVEPEVNTAPSLPHRHPGAQKERRGTPGRNGQGPAGRRSPRAEVPQDSHQPQENPMAGAHAAAWRSHRLGKYEPRPGQLRCDGRQRLTERRSRALSQPFHLWYPITTLAGGGSVEVTVQRDPKDAWRGGAARLARNPGQIKPYPSRSAN